MNTTRDAIPTSRPAPGTLSCTSCRQRKMRCNKTNPCFPCQIAGIECITPTRARTVRTARQVKVRTRDSELLRRIHRLETLLSNNAVKPPAVTGNNKEPQAQLAERAQNYASPSADNNGDGSLLPAERVDQKYAFFIKKQENENRYRSGEFWTSLGHEVSGIRQLLENEPEEEDEPKESATGNDSNDFPPQLLFGYPDSKSIPGHGYPSDDHREKLFHIYFSNIDPICKILHKPSISFHILQGSKDLLDDRGRFKFSSIEAITFSMYFASVMSITPEECLKSFGQSKNTLLAWFQRSTEVALINSNFMDTADIVTLQAFVLYIMTLRSQHKTRSSWALVGLAIRLAHSQRLHIDLESPGWGIFEIELRRRLWWQIIVLDTQAAEDRGLEPMVLENSYTTLMPSNCNDVEFEFKLGKLNPEQYASRSPQVDRTGVTEMTFSLMCMDTVVVFRKLNFVPLTKKPPLTLQEKEALVKQCANKIETKYLGGCDPTDKLVWITYMFARLLILKLWLTVQYPLHAQDGGAETHTRQQSLQDAISFLNISDILEQNCSTSGIRWFFTKNVPWHALAVMLAELLRKPQGSLADQAWVIIDKSFKKWSDRMDGAVGGMSRHPIKILLEKAQAARYTSIPAAKPHDNLQAGLPSHLSQQNTHLVPDLTDLNLETNLPYLYGNSTVQELNTIDLSHPSVELDTFPALDTPMPSANIEIGEGAINWDNWNEFIFDSNLDGGDRNDSIWETAMQI